MHVLGGPFTNFASNTLTGGSYNVSGNLEIDQLGSTGGEIKTNAANITLNGATSSFVDSAGKDALSSLNTNAATGIFTISGGRNFTTQSDLTNNGTLGVGTGSKFVVSGNLTNFSGTTLTGGVYNIGGTLQFTGANIVTNAATISLSGSAAQIVNQSGSNGLANFATNAAAGVFEISSSHPFTTAGNFTNNGTYREHRQQQVHGERQSDQFLRYHTDRRYVPALRNHAVQRRQYRHQFGEDPAERHGGRDSGSTRSQWPG